MNACKCGICGTYADLQNNNIPSSWRRLELRMYSTLSTPGVAQCYVDEVLYICGDCQPTEHKKVFMGAIRAICEQARPVDPAPEEEGVLAEQAEGMDALIEAFEIFRQYTNKAFPTGCEHDSMYVFVNPEDVSELDKERLKRLGFDARDDLGSFESHRYGSG